MPHSLHNAIHFHHHHEDEEFREVFWMRTVRSFGVSFVAIFVPIYILNEAASTSEAVNQLTIYYALLWGLRAVLLVPTAQLIAKIGTKHALAMSAVFLVFWMASLTLIEQSVWFLYGAGALSALIGAMFFTALHAHAAMATKRRSSSKQLSNLLIMRRVAMSLGPLVGGIIAENYGFEYALYAGGLVSLLSILFLNLDHDLFLNRPTWGKALRSIDRYSATAFVSITFQNTAVSVFWPLFISFIISSYDGIGLIVTASLVISITVMHVMGLHGSGSEERKQLKLGTRSLALVNIGRGAASSGFGIGAINFLNDITYSMSIVPFVNQYYATTRKRKNSLSYICGMEILANIGYLLAILTFYLVFVIVGDMVLTLTVMFVLAGVVTPLISNIVSRYE